MKTDLHEESITFMLFNPFGSYVLSFAGGMPEIWDPDTFELPSQFLAMTDTDLYELCDTIVIAAEFSQKYLVI